MTRRIRNADFLGHTVEWWAVRTFGEENLEPEAGRSAGRSRRGVRMSTEPVPGLVPEHMRIRYQGDPVMMTVDGQRFRVRVRAEQPGAYDFDWLNGPHEYGFGISRGDRSAMSLSEMEDAIRDFLAQIDPTTGYLEDQPVPQETRDDP